MIHTKSDFEWMVHRGVVCITDQDGRVSVTNDIENVIKYMHQEGVDLSQPVVYKDSQGGWDAVRLADEVDGYEFLDFNLMCAFGIEDACDQALALRLRGVI